MHFRRLSISIFGIIMLFAAVSASCQTAPSYQAQGLPLVVGVGPSSYDVDWGRGRMLGATLWADWYPKWVPRMINGLGLEFEARDISLNRSDTQPNLRQDTVGGGPIYTWRHFPKMHPYVKYLISYGSIDFTTPNPAYTHDTRTVKAPGLGFEYRVYHQYWVRADYEYQTWQPLYNGTLKPQGFTLGVSYDFLRPWPH
jgi:hypothetical protein